MSDDDKRNKKSDDKIQWWPPENAFEWYCVVWFAIIMGIFAGCLMSPMMQSLGLY